MFSHYPYHNTPYTPPHLHSSYYPQQQQRSSPYLGSYGYPARQEYGYRPTAYERALAQEQARQRARRAQYLPDEDEDEDVNQGYPAAYGLDPRERLFLEAKRIEALEQRRRQEEEEQRAREVAEERAREERVSRPRSSGSYIREADKIIGNQAQRLADRTRRGSMRTVPINTTRRSASPNHRPAPPTSPQSKPSPSPSPSPPPSLPQQPQYTPQHHDAASTIQSHYRAHRAHRTINSLDAQFRQLKAEFTPPTTIDFQTSDGNGTVSLRVLPTGDKPEEGEGRELEVPKLAYTHRNAPLLAYAEELSRLLVKLDAVESWGVKAVRERRRQVVRAVEAEAEALERLWKGVWANSHPGSPCMNADSIGGTDVDMQAEPEGQEVVDTTQAAVPRSEVDDVSMQEPLAELDARGDTEFPSAPEANEEETGEVKEVLEPVEPEVEGGDDPEMSLTEGDSESEQPGGAFVVV
ncbi:hypothetical protein BD779DRAFT_1521733 [Infundibulicybe gibba]|nr:hypothetical protein BD779DRAFT_1521733 [Infundibulicybe gibba]